MSVGSKIKEIRKEKNLSQKDLGDRLHVSQSMIAQYESGSRDPKPETLQKIADALDVNVSILLRESLKVFTSDIIDNMDFLDIKISDKLTLEHLTADELEQKNRYVKMYNRLNALGRKEAIKRIDELTQIDKYKAPTD